VTATCASEVGEWAFNRCENLFEAILPNTNSVVRESFSGCFKLTNVRLPNATSIGEDAFANCYPLCRITLHANANTAKDTFFGALSLVVLATCAGFELDTGDKHPSGHLDPTVLITHYLKWRCEMDDNKEKFKHWHLMLKLSNWHMDKKTGGDPRCWPVDPVSKFMFKHKDAGVISHILSFFGEKRGYGDLRGVSNERLWEIGLEFRVLRKEYNYPGLGYLGE